MNSFDKETTADEVLADLDVDGRRFAITGASGGLGEQSARSLAAKGAKVSVLARDPEKLEGALGRIRSAVPDADLDGQVVDLASLASVRSSAEAYLQTHDAFDVLINNAGVMACPFGLTSDGFETQFGTNHLGHFLLTALLAPALVRGESPRVVTLSSSAHGQCDVDLDDPNFETTPYRPWDGYGRSKSANALFARELATRSAGSGLLSFSVHPGAIMTDLGRHLTDELLAEAMERAKARAEKVGEAAEEGFVFKTPEAGAATQVFAATYPGLEPDNGAYFADCRVGELGVNVGSYGIEPHILNDETAKRLWDLSEEMVGQPFEV